MRLRGQIRFDPSQLPRDLKEPATQPGQPPAAGAERWPQRSATVPGAVIGYLVGGKFYHPADVEIVRESP